MATLKVARVGRVEKTDDPLRPFRFVDADGTEAAAVSEFLHHMLADDASPTSLRSCAYELLAWVRFLRAVDVPWHLASRVEARDFALWLKTTKKPPRRRRPGLGEPGHGEGRARRELCRSDQAARSRGDPLVLRVPPRDPRPTADQPVPAGRGCRRGESECTSQPDAAVPAALAPGHLSAKEPKPTPRIIPEQEFNDLFAGLKYNRDRALIAFYISIGARASELLGVPQGLVAPGDQTIGVVRKGNQVLQHLPASADAFVWLRLYQQELRGMVPKHPSEPLWWTLRRPFRPLEYDAARMVFTRANQLLGANWTLHDLRHSTAKRMVRDPNLTLADVQWVMGHAHITTTEIYIAPTPDEVVAHVLAHHERQRAEQVKPPAPPAPGYRPEVLAALFGTSAAGGENR
ncbi:site-specific integrase [Streptomyces jumonjinensis]|uniref:tyrosine-type recombinase/integrase n=1 Tax=Streptomyces jumonjinensis TaxID=1945 RepID=UPI00331A09DB